MKNTFQNDVLKNIFTKLLKLELPISGGCGCSIDDAIVVDLQNEAEAVQMEYKIMNGLGAFIDKKPAFIRQETLVNNARHFDRLVFKVEEVEYDLFFDVTRSFGKVGM